MTDRVEIERRCGMIMGARHGHMTLTWLPDRGRHGTRTWVLTVVYILLFPLFQYVIIESCVLRNGLSVRG